MRARTAVMLAGLLLSGCTRPEEKANSLYVDAAKLVSESQTASDDAGRYQALLKAQQAAETILADHSGTNAALKVSAGDPIGGLSLPQINQALATLAASPAICMEIPTTACLSGMLERAVRDNRPDATVAASYLMVLAPDTASALILSLMDPKKPAGQREQIAIDFHRRFPNFNPAPLYQLLHYQKDQQAADGLLSKMVYDLKELKKIDGNELLADVTPSEAAGMVVAVVSVAPNIGDKARSDALKAILFAMREIAPACSDIETAVNAWPASQLNEVYAGPGMDKDARSCLFKALMNRVTTATLSYAIQSRFNDVRDPATYLETGLGALKESTRKPREQFDLAENVFYIAVDNGSRPAQGEAFNTMSVALAAAGAADPKNAPSLKRYFADAEGVYQSGLDAHATSLLGKLRTSMTGGKVGSDDVATCYFTLAQFNRLAPAAKQEATSLCIVAFLSNRLSRSKSATGHEATATRYINFALRSAEPQMLDALDNAAAVLDEQALGVMATSADYTTDLDPVLDHPLFDRLADKGLEGDSCRGLDKILAVRAYNHSGVKSALASIEKMKTQCHAWAFEGLASRKLYADPDGLRELAAKTLERHPKLVADVYTHEPNKHMRAVVSADELIAACSSYPGCPSASMIKTAAAYDTEVLPMAHRPTDELIDLIKTKDYPPKLVGHLAIRMLTGN